MKPASMLANVLLGLAVTAYAQEPPKELTVGEIVDQANHVAYYQGQDGRALVRMSIFDKKGKETKRMFVILRRDATAPEGWEKGPDAFTGDQQFYVYFLTPADVNKMVFVVHKQVGGDDNRWLYMPALDNLKRIAPSDKRTSFVGSHFLYEDVSGRNLDEDTHELVKTTENYYVVKNTPKDPKTVEFAYYTMYIAKGSFVTVQVKYYDEKDENFRTYTVPADGVTEIQGFKTITKSVMEDKRLGGKTIMEYDRVKYDVDLPEEIFMDVERYTAKPPREYLK